MTTYTVRHYLDVRARDVVTNWLAELRDNKAKIQIIKRLNRLELGNFGDHKFCRDGVWELRIDEGPGYRVYYTLIGTELVLLLCGGDKRSQNKDIERACEFALDWQRRVSK
jgi:putative addiction module killer protein